MVAFVMGNPAIQILLDYFKKNFFLIKKLKELITLIVIISIAQRNQAQMVPLCFSELKQFG